MKIALGSDHRGYELKEVVKASLARRGLETEDLGTHGKASVDYTDYAGPVARMVSEDPDTEGILICATGLGMSIAANKVPRVRAALALNPDMARMARLHNNANILVLSGDQTTPAAAEAILDRWLGTKFEGAVRHKRRIRKVHALEASSADMLALCDRDPEVYSAIRLESRRQQDHIELIASENLVSQAVREAQGSVMTNKYAEGYPGKRWYNGCQHVDEAERLAIERAKQLFGADHANVQPHSGSGANMAVYMSVLEPGDTILAMKLSHGGHLTHGHTANFSGRLYRVVSYGVSKETEQIDYDEMAEIARKEKPRLIVAGCSAYSRIIDFRRLRQTADSVGAYLMADIAHIAGLVVGGCHPSPVPFCEFVTATTHKTLRGPRGGFILCQARFAEDIDRQVFPGIQGGPLMHVVAAKAVCFLEALRPSFRNYQEQVVRNAKALAEKLAENGLRIVSGGTDNHLALVDLTPVNVTGKDAATALESVGITVNKNSIPFDQRSPFLASGIRVGSPAVTSRGMEEEQMKLIADMICQVLKNIDDKGVLERVRKQVAELTAKFPVRQDYAGA